MTTQGSEFITITIIIVGTLTWPPDSTSWCLKSSFALKPEKLIVINHYYLLLIPPNQTEPNRNSNAPPFCTLAAATFEQIRLS